MSHSFFNDKYLEDFLVLLGDAQLIRNSLNAHPLNSFWMRSTDEKILSFFGNMLAGKKDFILQNYTPQEYKEIFDQFKSFIRAPALEDTPAMGHLPGIPSKLKTLKKIGVPEKDLKEFVETVKKKGDPNSFGFEKFDKALEEAGITEEAVQEAMEEEFQEAQEEEEESEEEESEEEEEEFEVEAGQEEKGDENYSTLFDPNAAPVIAPIISDDDDVSLNDLIEMLEYAVNWLKLKFPSIPTPPKLIQEEIPKKIIAPSNETLNTFEPHFTTEELTPNTKKALKNMKSDLAKKLPNLLVEGQTPKKSPLKFDPNIHWAGTTPQKKSPVAKVLFKEESEEALIPPKKISTPKTPIDLNSSYIESPATAKKLAPKSPKVVIKNPPHISKEVPVVAQPFVPKPDVPINIVFHGKPMVIFKTPFNSYYYINDSKKKVYVTKKPTYLEAIKKALQK